MKRILTIQDISCVGKCSLTVALPVISAFGVETSVLPTAILSTHTAFSGFTFRDLTDDMLPNVNHFEEQKLGFDALYTGYLGSIKQIEIVSEIFARFKNKNNFILVDPVMADNGKLYAGFDEKFASTMSKLCSHADIIVPNLTEASFLLNQKYVGENYDEEFIKNTLKALTNLGTKKAVLTGISLDKINLGVYGYDSEKDEYFSYCRKHLPKSFHGTGDVFASALCGALTIGKNLDEALKIAVDFTVLSIEKTIENPNSNWYGVEFEKALPNLIEEFNK